MRWLIPMRVSHFILASERSRLLSERTATSERWGWPSVRWSEPRRGGTSPLRDEDDVPLFQPETFRPIRVDLKGDVIPAASPDLDLAQVT